MKYDHHMEPYHPDGDPTVTDFWQVPNSASNVRGLEHQVNTMRNYTHDLDNTSRWCGWVSHICVQLIVWGLIYMAITPAWHFLPLLIIPAIGLFITASKYFGALAPAMEYDKKLYDTLPRSDYKKVSQYSGRQYHADKHGWGWRDYY